MDPNEKHLYLGDKKIKFRHLWWRRVVLFLFGLLLWVCILVPSAWWFKSENEARKLPKHFVFPYKEQVGQDYVSITMKMEELLLEKRKISIGANVQPEGRFRVNQTKLFREDVQLNFHFLVKKFEKLKPNEGTSIPIALENGNVRDYPFDEYLVELPIRPSVEVPITLEFNTMMQNYHFTLTQHKDTILIKINRSTTTLLFCLFVNVLMWLLSLTMFNMAYGSLILKKDPPAPVLGVGISILFALPSLRSTQPQVPQIGCLVDVMGFFWAIFFVGFASIVVILCWVLRWKHL